jgi:outer membrane receptor for ferrienterochelin and colicins
MTINMSRISGITVQAVRRVSANGRRLYPPKTRRGEKNLNSILPIRDQPLGRLPAIAFWVLSTIMALSGLRRTFAKLGCTTTLLGILLCPSVTGAQTVADQEDLIHLSIEDLTKIKVFSASRHLEASREAPAAITMITAEEIKRYGWRTLGEILRSVRGFYTSDDRQYTYLGVRGIRRPGDYNARILLQLNGHRLNDNIYDQAMLGTEFPLDLDLIDHIEIVRGPGSSLFGTNAVFAIINVITRRPGKRTLEASGETGSFLGRTGRVTASAEKGRWSGLFSGSLYRSNGPEKLFFPEFAAPATNNGIAENMDWDRVGQAFVDVQYGNLRVQSFFANRNKVVPTASYGVVFDDPRSRDRDTRGGLDVSYHLQLSPQTDLDLRTYYDGYEYYGPSVYEAPGKGRYVQVTRQRTDWSGAEANLGVQLGKQRITIGGDYEYTLNVSQKNYIVGQPPSFSVNDNPWFSAVYGEAQLNLIPKVTIRAGGRFDWFSTFGGTLSPRVALIYSPTARTALKYIFGRAFRAPGAFEEFYIDNISIQAPPKPLRPEQVQSNEIVFERTLTPWLSMTADGYYNNLLHIIENVTAPSGLSYFVNDAQDRARGIEFELEAKRASGLAVRASYALSNAYDVDHPGAQLANSPLHQAKLNATLPIVRRGFAGLELLSFSEQQSFRGTKVPASFLCNITLSSNPLWHHWEFSASSYNVLNHPLFTPMGPNDPEAVIRQDGRSFRVKVAYRLGREGK